MGEVAGLHVGDHLRREYLILGDPIDQVAKAEGMAQLGELVASREVVNVLMQAGALSAEDEEDDLVNDANKHCSDGYRVIANRKVSSLSLKLTEQLSSSNNNGIHNTFNNSNNNDTSSYDGTLMNVATLEQYRNLISLYVHPVIRNDELDIYNSLGLNQDPTVYNTANISTNQTQQSQSQQSQQGITIPRKLSRNATQLRHRAEAELRGVYTMFICPLIEAKLTGNEDKDRQLCEMLNRIMLVVSRVLKRYRGHLRQYIVDDKGVVLIATFGLRGSACPNM